MDNTTPHRLSAIAQNPWLAVLPPLVLCVAVILCYLPAFYAQSVFDSVQLSTRRDLREPQPLWRAVTAPRGLVNWTFAVQHQMFGRSPRAWVVFNISIHLLAALTLLGIARRTLSLPKWPAALRENATLIGLAIALLWAVHPLQTQAVTYHIQRFESMMAFVFLLAIYCVVRGQQSPRPWLWYGGAIACSFLGMSCKTIMVMAPLVILLFDYSMLAASWKKIAQKRWVLYVGLLATAAWGVFLERGVFDPNRQGYLTAGLGTEGVTSWEYFRTQPQVLLHYLGLVFWPQSLCFDYRWPVENSALGIYGPGLVIVGLLAASLAALWWKPAIGFLGLAFFLVLAPTSSVIPLADLAVEHRLYLPLAPLVALAVIAVVLLTNKVLQHPQARRLLPLGLLVLVTLGLMARTFVRNFDYVNPERLWSQAIKVNPRNDRAYSHLGILAANQGRIDDAYALHTKAIELRDSPGARYSLAVIHGDRGELEIAIRHLQRAIEIDPREPINYRRLGVYYGQQGNDEAAIRSYQQAIKLDPLYAPAHNNLALILQRRGDTAGATKHYQQAIAADARYVLAKMNLGSIYHQQRRYDDAIELFQAALRLEPRNARLHMLLGEALGARGDAFEGLVSLRKAIELAPQRSEPKLRTAWLLATSPDALVRDGTEAVKLAEASISPKKPSAEALDVLAAAYAAAGRFEDAQATQLKALALVKNDAAMRQRLETYRQQQPYIEH